jgi:hypothetical protein
MGLYLTIKNIIHLLIHCQNTIPNIYFGSGSQYQNNFSGYQGNIRQETRPMIQKYS